MPQEPPDDCELAETVRPESTCAPPRRNDLASQLDKARAYASLFGEPMESVRIGRFTLRSELGSGGMGEVYEAYDDQLDRKLAIKLVRSDQEPSHHADDRLQREAQTLARLSHPNVVQVYEVGRFEGRVFIAMEFIKGQSLRVWLKEHAERNDSRRQRQVLDLFIAAGRGLQAMHEAGLIHRDFKPDNVLIGKDARPRVADFGLARVVAIGAGAAGAGADNGQAPPGAGADADTADQGGAARALTNTGQVLGTPPYIAPEQMKGKSADARSDQFSYCVALYEALCGRTPFPAHSIAELQHLVGRGEIPAPPSEVTIPAPVYKVLVRGLATDPAARFPDMGALIDALEAWPRRRRRWFTAAAVAAIVTGSVVTYEFVIRPPDQCSDIEATISQRWTTERKATIRDAFTRTGLPYAEATWNAVAGHLDQYANRLGSEMQAACEATHKHGVQSAEIGEQRMLCLSSRRRRFHALIDEFERADAAAVEHASQATAALPGLATCDHPETLRYGMRPPGREIASEVARIRDRLATALTLELFGKDQEALDIARVQLTRAEQLKYAPVIAEALGRTGRLMANHGSSKETVRAGEDQMMRAETIAEGARYDELVAEIRNNLVLSAIRHHSNTKQARAWNRDTRAVIERIGNPPRLRAEALRSQGRIEFEDGQFAKAEVHQREALRLLESAPDAPRLLRGLYLHDLASTMWPLGNHGEAKRLYDQALALHIDELGATHPYIAELRVDIAELYLTGSGQLKPARDLLAEVLATHDSDADTADAIMGRAHYLTAVIELREQNLDRADVHAQHSLAIFQRIYGENHVRLADVYERVGAIAFRRGHYDQALTAYGAGLALIEQHRGPDHFKAGVFAANSAEVAVAMQRHKDALASITRAETILAPYRGQPEVGAFLATVRGQALLGLGRTADAVQALEYAVRGLEGLPAMTAECADAQWALARALRARDGDPDPGACALADKALRFYAQQGPEIHTPKPLVQRFVADCPATPDPTPDP